MANQVDGQSVGRILPITASDTTRFEPTIGICVNVGGNINVLCVNDAAPDVIAVNAGVFYPLRAIAVYATSTTATGINALYQN